MPYDPNIAEERLLIVADTFAGLIRDCAYLAAAPAIPVVTERQGDINATIQQALNTLGLSVAVIMPDGDQVELSGESLSMRVRLVAQISENVLINQAKATATNTTYRPALGATLAAMKAVDRKPNGLDLPGVRHQPRLNEFTLQLDQPFRLVPATRPTYHLTAFTTVEL